MKIVVKIKHVIKVSQLYWFDLKNDIKYTTLTHDVVNDQEMLLSSLVVAAHTIEKGLTMPHKRIPFGEAKALEILQGCTAYINKGYDLTESRFVDIVCIMKEYRDAIIVRGVIDCKSDSYIDGILKKNAAEFKFSSKVFN